MKIERREFLVALGCGLGVLGFIVYGVMHMGGEQEKASVNTLTGKVVAKKFTPAPEQQLSFGRKGLKNEQFAGEFLLQVHVKSENRTFDVPVDESTYNAVRVGSSFSFQRPRSEQIK